MVVSTKSQFIEMPSVRDDDLSISKDSVFDWGSLPGSRSGMSTLTSAEGLTTAKKQNKLTNGDHPDEERSPGNTTRYDPKSLNKIVDINDLVDSSDSDDDDEEVGTKTSTKVVRPAGDGRRNSNNRGGDAPVALWCRQAVVIVALIGIIAGASLAIGYAVVSSDPTKNNSNEQPAPERTSQEGMAAYSVAKEGPSSEGDPQQLLELAEQIVSACSESSLNHDMQECQALCHDSVCCFDPGEYSCEDDVGKDCPVYAGCEALVLGLSVEFAVEGEE